MRLCERDSVCERERERLTESVRERERNCVKERERVIECAREKKEGVREKKRDLV